MKYIIFTIIILLIGAGFYYLRSQEYEEALPATPPPREEIKNIEQELNEVANNIEALANDFDLDAPFIVHRIWIEDGKFYMEYENKKGILGQLLVIREGNTYRGVGYFNPSESGWALQAGEGEVAGPSASLYEKDLKGHWIKKN